MSAAIRFSPVGKVPGAPRFSEAYARLDFRKAQRACQLGLRICWFTRHGHHYGHLEIYNTHGREHTIWIEGGLSVANPPVIKPARPAFSFPLERVPCGANELRWYVRCPQCEVRRSILIYGNDWACRQCHRLLNRSQIVDPVVRLRERAWKLRDEVGRGRRKGMHSRTFLAMRRELAGLEQEIAQYPWAIGSIEQRMVSARWIDVEEALRWDLPIKRDLWSDIGNL